MKPKACRSGRQAQLAAMRFTKFAEKPSSFSSEGEREIQLTSETKHYTQAFGQSWSLGLWLYVFLFSKRHDILSRNKTLWERCRPTFYMLQFLRIKYHVEMTAAQFI